MDRSQQESIGERTKRLRRRRVMTQAELSRISRVPLPTIKDIERGATTGPRPATLRMLAAALGVDASYLLNGGDSLDTRPGTAVE